MRVLHLPVNIASLPSHTVRGLRQIGVEARGLVFGDMRYQSTVGLKAIHHDTCRSLAWLYRRLLFTGYVLRWSQWAEVLHWYFGAPALPWGLDLALMRVLNKAGVVEWLGSDIRIAEVECADNPYYAAECATERPSPSPSLRLSLERQKRFAAAGFACLVAADMAQYVYPGLWSRVYCLPQRIVVADYEPIYPDPAARRPVLVHSSTNPRLKGTSAVLQAVEHLKTKYNFEFRLISGASRDECLRSVREADVFLDQFLLGSHGLAALEAMAYGKPVVGYIKPSLVERYPADLPIINANPDNLADVLESLLQSGRLRYEAGRRGRLYVEKHHDAVRLAPRLAEIYRQQWRQKRSGAQEAIVRERLPW